MAGRQQVHQVVSDYARDSFSVFGASRQKQLWRAGTTIFRQGDNAHFLYFLKSGSVKGYIGTEDGREKRLCIYDDGALLGASAFILNLPREFSAAALGDSEIVAVDRASFEAAVARNPQILWDLLEIQALEARQMTFQTIGTAFISARIRLVDFLLRLIHSGRLSLENGVYCIYSTQESLAETIGVSRVTVNRILSQLRAGGLIETGYNTIVIRDAAALETVN